MLTSGTDELDAAIADAEGRLDAWTAKALDAWPATVEQYAGDELVYVVRGKEFHTPLRRESLSGTQVPRVALPRTTDHGELVRFLREEGLPGSFPFTAGVFPFKRPGGGAGAHVRRRGRRLPHQPPVQAAVAPATRRPACRRRSTR